MKSNITVCYTLENNLRLIEVDAMESIALVIRDNVGCLGAEDEADEDEIIITLHDRSLWKDLFLRL
jgi:hypothetical protein